MKIPCKNYQTYKLGSISKVKVESNRYCNVYINGVLVEKTRNGISSTINRSEEYIDSKFVELITDDCDDFFDE